MQPHSTCFLEQEHLTYIKFQTQFFSEIAPGRYKAGHNCTTSFLSSLLESFVVAATPYAFVLANQPPPSSRQKGYSLVPQAGKK